MRFSGVYLPFQILQCQLQLLEFSKWKRNILFAQYDDLYCIYTSFSLFVDLLMFQGISTF